VVLAVVAAPLLVLAVLRITPAIMDALNALPARPDAPAGVPLEVDESTLTRVPLGSKKLAADPEAAPVVAFGEVRVELPPGAVSKPSLLEVSALTGVDFPGAVAATGVEVSVGDIHRFDEPVAISMPGGRAFRGLTTGDRVVCLTRRKEGAPYEAVPSLLDGRGRITVLTDHLSPFHAIRLAGDVRRQHSPTMKISDNEIPFAVWIRDQRALHTLAKVTTADARNLGPGAASLAWSGFNEAFALGTNATALAENAAFMDGLAPLNKYVPEIGMGLALVQLAMDLNGDDTTRRNGVLNFIKSSGYYAIAKKLPTRAMNIAMVGVFAIDYSLNAFGQEAWAGRKEMYETLGKRWLQLRRQDGEGAAFWKTRLRKVFRAHEDDPAGLADAVEASYDEYVAQFFQDDTEIALLQKGFGGGGGLNDDVRSELSAGLKEELKQRTRAVVSALANQAIVLQQRAVRERLRAAAAYLNATHEIRFVVKPGPDEKTDGLAGREVGLAVEDRRKAKLWRTTLDADGRAIFRCTNLGYIDAGFPKRAYLILPAEGGQPSETIQRSFRLSRARVITVEFGNDADLAGTWAGTLKIESAGKAVHFIREMMIKFAVSFGADEPSARRGIEAVVEEAPDLKRPRKLRLKLSPDPRGRNGRYLVELSLDGEKATGVGQVSGRQLKVEVHWKDRSATQLVGTLRGERQLEGRFAIKAYGLGPTSISGQWSAARK